VNRGWRLVLAAAPGAVLAAAALAGWAPAFRDLAAYFVPLRARTAEVVEGKRGPYWNPDCGCGEPYFANPQTDLLYPPGWLATLIPAPRAVWVEAGLHLALLATGVALLAARLGAAPWLELAAAWGVALAGPSLDAAGVLNNLETLAWLPWLWWAAMGGSWRRLAAFAALAYLGAEPQLALIGVAIALALAPRRRTLVALALAAGLVAIQAVPFAAWVRGGDRGSTRDFDEPTAGSVQLVELPAFAVPGMPLRPRSDRFVSHLTVPLWVAALGVIAVITGPRPTRVLAISGWALLAASVLPSLRYGDVLWAALTGGMVRYPGRLVFPAVIALVVAAAASVRRRTLWVAAIPPAVAVVTALAVGASFLGSIVQAAAAGLVTAGVGAPVAALASEAALVPFLADVADLHSMQPTPRTACLEAQLDPRGRVYAVEPSKQQIVWVSGDPGRSVALGLGYPSLVDGRRMVRTFAPLESRALALHLAEADKGPAARWWLDSLAARRVVAQHPVPTLQAVCREGELTVFDNPEAWPEAMLVRTVPAPGEEPVAAGRVVGAVSGDDHRAWRVEAPPGGALLLWLATPDPGWRYRVDQTAVAAIRGVGIIHGVPVPAGIHEVSAVYRPPGLLAGAVVSALSVLVWLGGAWRRW
jgi:hypothetical protein